MSISVNLDSISRKISDGVDPINAVPDSLIHISEGTERRVYRYNDNSVVKFSLASNQALNQNVREKTFYDRVKNTPVSDFFASVTQPKNDSKAKKYIVQEYIKQNRPVSKTQINEWIEEVNEYNIEVHDARPVNFGYRGNQLVMLDYAGCFFIN